MPAKPLMGRADRSWRWRLCLASWLAALLAIAPVAERPVALDPTAAQATIQPSARDHHAAPSLNGLQVAEPAGLGILSRLSLVDPTFGPAPAKTFLRTSAPDVPAYAPEAAGVPKVDAAARFHRSSVGTARTPTGPPS